MENFDEKTVSGFRMLTRSNISMKRNVSDSNEWKSDLEQSGK